MQHIEVIGRHLGTDLTAEDIAVIAVDLDDDIGGKAVNFEAFRDRLHAGGVNFQRHEHLVHHLLDLGVLVDTLFESFAVDALITIEMQQHGLASLLSFAASRFQIGSPSDLGGGWGRQVGGDQGQQQNTHFEFSIK